MARPFSSPHIPSSSWVTRRPPPWTSSPSVSTTRTSASSITACRPRRRAVAPAASLHLGPGEIAELARNKVLIAATVASAIGQLSKPFTSVKNGGVGAGLDLRTVFRSGGMPSTHSASVVAVATSLGLERGFADSIFGMSVVFAAIVMYDAQGVRREVGNHAKVLNRFWILKEKVPLEYSEVDMAAPGFVSVTEEASSNASPSLKRGSSTESPRVNGLRGSEPELTELKQACVEEDYRLSESVGHTELQVTVGALLGFAVSLAVYATL
ncbi:putative membrane protein YuiD [Zea mays]|uniref:Putative membrane protein YuiD n=1 Tax=Zea mays TaxID=4577 RepID=A0A3L6EA45_MAIZE|nr:putative membrane protein YuiD [Zea mays]